MSTVITETPTGPSSKRPTESSALPAVPQRTFNNSVFSIPDPIQGSGFEVTQFAFAATYPVAPDKQQVVVRDLFSTLYDRLRGKCVPGAEPRIVDFKDAATGSSEPARRYLVVTSETRRGTHMGVFATFRAYGDYLYVSVDSYMLPPLSNMQFLKALFVAFMFVMVATTFTFGLGFFFAVPVLFWTYRDVLASILGGDSLALALRRRFHAGNNTGTFNSDDMLAYFKCTALVLAEGMQEVFEAHGLSVAEVQRYRQNVNYTTQVINAGGTMNIWGTIMGGFGNQVKTA